METNPSANPRGFLSVRSFVVVRRSEDARGRTSMSGQEVRPSTTSEKVRGGFRLLDERDGGHAAERWSTFGAGNGGRGPAGVGKGVNVTGLPRLSPQPSDDSSPIETHLVMRRRNEEGDSRLYPSAVVTPRLDVEPPCGISECRREMPRS